MLNKIAKWDITITGDLGSGKSSISKKLCLMLHYKYFSTGDIQRQIGKEKGMDTLTLNYFAEKNQEIDKYIDDQVKKINDDPDSYIVDSRMAWYFIINSCKIYLTANPMVAAKRVMADKDRNNEPHLDNVAEKSLNLLERRAAEDKRFLLKYGVDCSDLNNFDIIIDTTIPDINDITNLIFRLFKKFLNKEKINKHWVSPKIIFPTEHVRKLVREDAKEVRSSVEKTGYYDDSIIQTIKIGKDYFIWDGHQRTSAAIYNKVPLVPIVILTIENEEIIPGLTGTIFMETFNQSWVYDWEDVHGFRFESYPILNK